MSFSCYILLLALFATVIPLATSSFSNNLQTPSPPQYTIDANNNDDVQICFGAFFYSQHVSALSCPGGSGYGTMVIDSNSLQWEVLLGGDIYVGNAPEGSQPVLKLKNATSTIYTMNLNSGLNSPNRQQLIPFQTWPANSQLSLWAGGLSPTWFNLTTHTTHGIIVTTHLYWISM
jgi:hypothetical protein